MKLFNPTSTQFDEVWDVHKSSFSGVELAPLPVFTRAFYNSEIFVRHNWGAKINAFLMLEPRNTGSYVWAIAVGEQYRNRGLGGSLLEEAELWARENKKTHIELTVNANNRAQKLYFEAGYRVKGFLRHFYLGDGDGLLMRKGL